MHRSTIYDVHRKYCSEAGCYLYCHKKRGTHRLNEGTQRLDEIHINYSSVIICILYPSHCLLYYEV